MAAAQTTITTDARSDLHARILNTQKCVFVRESGGEIDISFVVLVVKATTPADMLNRMVNTRIYEHALHTNNNNAFMHSCIRTMLHIHCVWVRMRVFRLVNIYMRSCVSVALLMHINNRHNGDARQPASLPNDVWELLKIGNGLR